MKVFTFYVKFPQSFYVLRKNGPTFLRSMEKSRRFFMYYVKSLILDPRGLVPRVNQVALAAAPTSFTGHARWPGSFPTVNR